MTTTSKLDILRIPADKVHETIARSMHADGMDMVLDLDQSHGLRFVDEKTGREYLDFFGFFASNTLGFNHPALIEPEFKNHIVHVAVNKPSNSDVYTDEMAAFVKLLGETAQPESLPHLFLVAGGALAVENALKAAFDWKFQKRRQRGLPDDENLKVMHFKEAFHGRSGYTMSLTNTDPTKTRWFPKFDWPRITNPKITFPLDDHLPEVEAAEKRAIAEIERAIAEDGDRIACLIIEPIQGEGGDNHFRAEFFHELRRITLDNEMLLIVDEVQTGMGATGAWWAYQHLGFEPDILCFGKKMQACGIMASSRLDEVDSVFEVSSRINSTWGANLVDMVRATRYLQVIVADNLLANAGERGDQLLFGLGDLSRKYPETVRNVRGRGLITAFTARDAEQRDAILAKTKELGLLCLGCGPDSIRFRPALTVSEAEIDECLDILDKALGQV